MKTHFSTLAVLLFCFAACEKEPEQPAFPTTTYSLVTSPIPRITLESYAPEIVRANKDTLFFSFLYWDDDADAVTPVAGETTIRLRDNREPEQLVHDFFPVLSLPPNSSPVLSGGLEVALPHAVLLDPNSQEERTTFTLQLKDKAGNWSNVVRSGTITVRRGN